MSSRFRTEAAPLLAALLLALPGCDRDQDRAAPPAGSGMIGVTESALIPGGGHLPSRPDPRAAPYYNNAQAVQNGMRLFAQFNCAGCHFNGGGGIGPALMDAQWTYGGRLDQIYNSIYQGRPNGMPAWGGKIPDQQLWEIAAYVRSMSLPETIAAMTDRTPSQHPAPVPPEADAHDGWHLPPQAGGTAQ